MSRGRSIASWRTCGRRWGGGRGRDPARNGSSKLRARGVSTSRGAFSFISIQR
jgi:hypothetical protein